MTKKIIYLLFTCFFSISLLSQKSNRELEIEILALKEQKNIENYWNELHEKDQSVRGLVSEKQKKVDRENLKKMVLMIKYHGYPEGFAYGFKSDNIENKNFTPLIILTHNNTYPIREFLFPILKKAYDEGKANEFWYIHYLRGMVRDRYGRDFYDKKVENIPLFYDKLKPFVNTTISFDLDIIDSLFIKYDSEIKKITASKVIFKKKSKRITYTFLKTANNTLFLMKIFPDDSFNFPQEIQYDSERSLFIHAIDKQPIKEELIIKKTEKILLKL